LPVRPGVALLSDVAMIIRHDDPDAESVFKPRHYDEHQEQEHTDKDP
jgi:hypothetical protein